MIVDTGILYALTDRADPRHADAIGVLSAPEQRIVPEPVVVEADWLILGRLGVAVEVEFLRGLLTEAFVVEAITPADRARSVEIVEQYRDAELGYVDAAIVAVAERLGERTIATLDRRDFTLVKPRHVEAFQILP